MNPENGLILAAFRHHLRINPGIEQESSGMTKPRVAFIGTGLMGAPMATRLARAAYPLRVWNRTAAKAQALAETGATPVEELSAAIRDRDWQADVVITMLESGAVVRDVLTQILPLLTAGSTVIDMSSTRQDEAQDLAALLRGAQVHWIDAPVSGGVIGAEAGTLAIMAGGEYDIFRQLESLLTHLGRPVYVGPAGTGQLAKLCNQLIVGATIEIVAEALLLAEAGGADPSAVRDALRGGFAESRILEVHGRRMLERSFLPGGQVKTQLKDMNNILAAAQDAGLRLPVAAQVQQRFAKLVETIPTADHAAALLGLEADNPGIRLGDAQDRLP